MFKKIAFTMYPVTDMDRAKAFYEETLGLPPAKESVTGKWIEFDLPMGGCLALTTMAQGVTPGSEAGGSLAFEVDDIHALTETLKSRGVKFKMELFESPVCHMAVALDSEGNAFMLHQLKKTAG
ncbi:MAG: VOC family protein [Nannocystaceae bacterium]